ncbi:MAG: hypothetical protein IPM36_08375 [Lewinellaceae bacterium]|nr:hypothetical protein [Lewinellaceae bacterium]
MLFQNFNIDDFQCFTEKVHTPTGAIDYYLLYLTTPRDDDFIDWKRVFFDVNDPEKKVFSVIDAKIIPIGQWKGIEIRATCD